MKNNETYYDILELDSNATFEDIRNKYKGLVHKYHPDKSNINTDDKFKQVHEAYGVLSNYHKRREYDDKLSSIKDTTTTDMFGDAFDVFNNSFFSKGNQLNSTIQNMMGSQFNNMANTKSNFYRSSSTSSTVYNNGVETTYYEENISDNGKRTYKKEYIKKNNGKVIDHEISNNLPHKKNVPLIKKDYK
jgi:DnaJ-class molecular chaperone